MDRSNIIWGTGRLVRGLEKYIDLNEIDYFVDSDTAKRGTIFMGKEILLPEEIVKLEYDKLIIFVSKKYEEVYKQATEYLKIDKNKIIYWSHYYNYYNIQQTYKTIEDDCKNNEIEQLLDTCFCFQKNGLYIERNLELWNYGGIDEYFNSNSIIYKHVYPELKDVLKENHPQAIFLGRILSQNDMLRLEEEISFLLKNFQYIYFTLPYADSEQYCQLHKIKNKNYGEVKEWKLQYEYLLCVMPYNERWKTKIYIAMHKYSYVLENDLYIPLWLGEADKNKWGYQDDKQEPTIFYLNALINECTGLYWLWRHVKCDYIGLVHYRRYFLNDEKQGYKNILGKEKIYRIFKKYDIITASLIFFPITVFDQLKITVEGSAFYSGYQIIKKLLMERQPEYLSEFEQVMNGHSMFPCNMFVTKKEIFDCYCEWLFSIIIDAAKQIDVTSYDASSKRIIGFFAERLFTVWLIKQPLRIKEMPIWVTEDIMKDETDITRLKQ